MTKKRVHIGRDQSRGGEVVEKLISETIGKHGNKSDEKRRILRDLMVLTGHFTIFQETQKPYDETKVNSRFRDNEHNFKIVLKHDHFAFISEIPHCLITMVNTGTNRSCAYIVDPKKFNYFRSQLDWYKFAVSLKNPLINDDVRNYGWGDFEFAFIGLVKGTKNADMLRDYYINMFLDRGMDCYETPMHYKRFVKFPISSNIEHRLYPILRKHNTTLSQFVYRLVEKFLSKNVPSK